MTATHPPTPDQQGPDRWHLTRRQAVFGLLALGAGAGGALAGARGASSAAADQRAPAVDRVGGGRLFNEVFTWGANYASQLGRRTPDLDGPTPGLVPGVRGVVALAAGGEHTHVLMPDGTVHGWGRGSYGALGTAKDGDRLRPVRVAGLRGIVGITDDYPSMALDRWGRVWEWASMGATRPVDVPRQVRGIPGRVVAMRPMKDYGGAMVLLADGRLIAWGANRHGELGTGDKRPRWRPAVVPGLPPLAAVGAQHGSMFAVARTGEVYAWGINDSGELGLGVASHDRLRPERIPGLTRVVQLSQGAGYTLALRADGTVRSWGSNYWGKLGDGSEYRRTRPVRVVDLDRVVHVAAGLEHSMALRADGTVWTWGTNDAGQMGRGTTDGSINTRPRRVPDLTGIRAISVGGFHNAALR